MVGWCDGTRLHVTSSAEASYNLDDSRARAYCACSRCGWGLFGDFLLSSILSFSPLSPTLWETARYRLKYCLKGPLNPKQPTNPTIWITVGQGPTALAVGAGGGLFGHFYSHLSFLSSFSLSLGDGPIQTEILSQRAVKHKTTNQPYRTVSQREGEIGEKAWMRVKMSKQPHPHLLQVE